VLNPGWAWSTIGLSHIETSSHELTREDGVEPGWTPKTGS
jgi:hypothetical protein